MQLRSLSVLMPAALDVRPPSVSTTGFADGLGRRSIRFDRAVGATLECLQVRPELAAFEAALRAQAQVVDELDDERIVRVRAFDVHDGRLDVVSELLAGDRLSDIIEARAAGDSAVSGIDAAFGFLLQALTTLSAMHAVSLIHGAIAPGRIVLTTSGQVVLADAIYGTALPRLNLSRRRLWSELGIAVSPTIGGGGIDASADVSQTVFSALMLALGRSVTAADPAVAVAGLITEVAEIAQIRGGEPLAFSVRRFFADALSATGRRPELTADQSLADVRGIANRELGEDTCLAALAEFARYDAPEPTAIAAAPRPAAPRLAAVAPPVTIALPAPDPAPAPVVGGTPVVIPEPAVGVTPVATLEPVGGLEPLGAPESLVAPESIVLPEPLVVPALPLPAGVVDRVHVAIPAPVAPPAPAFTEAPGSAPDPVFMPVFVPTPVPAPAPRFTPLPVAMPDPVFTPAQQPAPAASQVRLRPATFVDRQMDPPVAVPAPSPALRIKSEPPAGYAPPPRIPRFLDEAPAPVRGPFPWKAAVAAVAVLTAGALGIRAYIQKPANSAPQTAAAPAAPAKAAAPLAPAATSGTLAIDSQPAGAHVLLNGTDVGQTPLRLPDIEPGRHTITLVSQTATVKRMVRVEAGKTAALDVAMYSGWVTVFSPIVLEVAEGSRSLGTTEQRRIMLPPGSHTLTLTHRAFGYSSVQTVEVGAGEEKTINLTPMGTVNLNAQPWAEVWIDGVRAGETPLANLQVPLGTREFTFKHPQLGERRVTATVTTTPSAVSVDLTKPALAPQSSSISGT